MSRQTTRFGEVERDKISAGCLTHRALCDEWALLIASAFSRHVAALAQQSLSH